MIELEQGDEYGRVLSASWKSPIPGVQTITFEKTRVPVCTTMLPQRVRDQMVDALRVDPGVPAGESIARTRELERVIFHARVQYPHLFKQ